MNEQIAVVVKNVFDIDVEVTLTRPEPQFGDYATNVALQISKQLSQNPRDIAAQIAEQLQSTEDFTEVSVAGPGFINIRLSNEALLAQLHKKQTLHYDGKVVVAEYSDPNPFKVLHAGHLYTTIVGDSISRLIAAAGGDVHRVNFGGDVGLHVAKNMWAILRYLDGENPGALSTVEGGVHEQSSWLSARYVEGNTAYEEDAIAKAEIISINQKIYALHANDDRDSPFAQIYWTCRQWSYDYFDIFYQELAVVPFEKYYPESQTAPIGVETVKRELENGVYEVSNDAVVFKGEPYGLHTRVFINSGGLPTYETKDVGVIMKKWQDYTFDLSLIITGSDIVEYMKVVQKSIEQFEPELVKRSRHLTHGNLKLVGGEKMSSRKGNVLLALDVLEAAKEAQETMSGTPDQEVMLGAVKYAFIKTKIGGDIIYNPEESVSLHGNSGPYLQYSHARAHRILEKSQSEIAIPTMLFDEDRALISKLGEYQEIIDVAVRLLEPHHICTYLFELAQEFNRYYEKNFVIGNDKEAHRVDLVALYADTLKAGLTILGINAPEKM